MKLAIIANPVAGGGSAYKKIRRCVDQWSEPNWQVEFLTTNQDLHAGSLAERLIETPPDLLAVCGGDGTVNQIASRIPHPPFPVAVLPGGTANVLARELGLPLDPIKALKIALKRKVRHVDLGVLGTSPDRRFVFVAGIGFDAFAVFSVRQTLKEKFGMAAYAVAILDCLQNYTFPEFQVRTENQTFAATSCLVCNSKRYGGGLLFCPDADMTDGLLDLLVLQGSRRIELVRFLIKAWLGIPEKQSWIHRLKVKSVHIEGPSTLLAQIDGELAGPPPYRIDLEKSSFPLVIP
jgi:YegS/Rv2252/BmrU family lipid kinase